MKKRTEILFSLGLFLLLTLIFWCEALPSNRTFFIRDLSTEIIPARSFWVRSGGFALWNPYGFLGMPYAANPQNQAFYPLNFFYLVLGAERGLVFFIIFHHWLFLSTFYLALRELGFKIGSSLLGAIGFGFGGFFCSLSMLIVLLSTVTWLPLIIIFLNRAKKKNWLSSGLGLGILIALQVLAGEIEIAGMSWALALLSVGFLPKVRASSGAWRKILGAFGLGIFFALLLSAVQWMLTLEMIPLSNRAEGFSLNDALLWSLEPFQLKSLVIPNYLLSTSRLTLSSGSYWSLGFFSEFPYFLSFYLGIIVLLVMFFALPGFRKWEIGIWILLALFALVMAMGNALPVYKFFYWHLPGFKLFRFPSKFLFLFYFAVVMLAVLGSEQINLKPRWIFSLVFFLAGIGLALYLIFSPVSLQDSSVGAELIAGNFFLRSIIRVLSFFFLGLSLIFLLSQKRPSWLVAGLAFLSFLDLFFAHRFLNPVIERDFYQGNQYIQDFIARVRSVKYPPRIASLSAPSEELSFQRITDPIQLYTRLRDGLENYWPIYFQIGDLRAYSLFCVSDVFFLEALLAQKHLNPGGRRTILMRSGVEEIYYRDYGFVRLSLPFPRALIFYQVGWIPNREAVFRIWSDPNFPALRTALIEGLKAEAVGEGRGMMSDFAEVKSYENEKIVIEAEAKEDGFLVLLDSYYPGWEAFVDGKRVKIYRANGFFRAVKIPAGRHTVVFKYYPRSFQLGVIISGLGFMVWFIMLGISFKIKSHDVQT